MNETVERRAVHIAAVILEVAGMCRYDSPTKCRRSYPSSEDCVKCMERWLLNKAKKQMQKEQT